MRPALIIVSIVLLLGCVFLFLREQTTRDELHRAQTDRTMVSNQLFEARVKLTEQVVNGVKLETNLTRRVDELLKTSGRLAAVSEKLGKTEALLQASQTQAQDLQKQVGVAQARVTELEQTLDSRRLAFDRQTGELERLTAEAARLQKQLAVAESKLQYVEPQLAAARDEFNDPLRLRRHLDHLKRVGRPSPSATTGPARGAHRLAARAGDPKGRLTMQPDGSVRLNP